MTALDPNSRWLRPIRKGEYDMVNMSLVNHDPVSGRPYDEMHAEWQVQVDAVTAEWDKLRWWDLKTRLRLRRYTFALHTHLGM